MADTVEGTIHVLTVHFNTPELTVELVNGIPKRSPGGRRIEIHILDNMSTVDNLRALQDGIAGVSNVRLQMNDRNVGFGVGVNILARADCIKDEDTIWVLNPDTRLDAHCLAILEEALDGTEFDVISPLIYSGTPADRRVWYCGGSLKASSMHIEHQLYGEHLETVPQHPFETEFVTGAAPMMRISTFRTVGGFPSNYFLYWEDTFFSWRARELNLTLGVVPAAMLWHAVGASSGHGQSPTFYYWYARNRFIFASDIGFPRWRLIAGSGAQQSLRFIAKALMEPQGRLRKMKEAVRGTWAGITHN